MHNIHISAPYHLEACRTFNEEVGEILSTYGFPVTLTQQALPESLWKPEADYSLDERKAVLDHYTKALKATRVLLCIVYPGIADTLSTLGAGMALVQNVPIIGARNAFSVDPATLTDPLPAAIQNSPMLLGTFNKWFEAESNELDDLMNPLMSFVNLYY
jgi:hypothetical protein